MIDPISFRPPSWFLPERFISTELQAKISRIAKSAFSQLALAFAVNLAFSVAIGGLMLPDTIAIFDLIVGIGLVAITIKAIWNRHSDNQSGKIERVSSKIARISIVNTLTRKLSIYIHEYGHALAAMTSFIKADPKITFNALGGETTFAISNGLTRFGQLLGKERSILFVTAAGPFTGVASGFTEIVCSRLIGNNHPLIGELLNDHGFAQIMDAMVYSMSTFATSKMHLGHDFMRLWQVGGIHPSIPLTLMLMTLGAGIHITYQRKEEIKDA